VNPLPNYPGSKGGSGVDKRLVSLMPPHRIYVEAFLGSGRVLDLKRPAALQIGLDISPSVVRAWRPAATPGLTLEYCEAWHAGGCSAVIAGTGGAVRHAENGEVGRAVGPIAALDVPGLTRAHPSETTIAPGLGPNSIAGDASRALLEATSDPTIGDEHGQIDFAAGSGFLSGTATPSLAIAAALAGPAVMQKSAPSNTPAPAIAAVPAGNGEARETHLVAPLCVAMVDALEWFASSPAMLQDPETLLYVDPPYLRSVRTRLFYDFELESPESHDQLLKLLNGMRCQVILSHYPCRFYSERLKHWRQVSYRTMTRGGVRIECAWCNFPEPASYHDPRWLGDGFRERERMKRKSKRWRAKFRGMASSERQVVATELAKIDRASLEAALRPGV
jgi:hypothetical protein